MPITSLEVEPGFLRLYSISDKPGEIDLLSNFELYGNVCFKACKVDFTILIGENWRGFSAVNGTTSSESAYTSFAVAIASPLMQGNKLMKLSIFCISSDVIVEVLRNDPSCFFEDSFLFCGNFFLFSPFLLLIFYRNLLKTFIINLKIIVLFISKQRKLYTILKNY